VPELLEVDVATGEATAGALLVAGVATTDVDVGTGATNVDVGDGVGRTKAEVEGDGTTKLLLEEATATGAATELDVGTATELVVGTAAVLDGIEMELDRCLKPPTRESEADEAAALETSVAGAAVAEGSTQTVVVAHVVSQTSSVVMEKNVSRLLLTGAALMSWAMAKEAAMIATFFILTD